MEQIFANPGFMHIAEKIITYLDPISMSNFKQVNQIIANHFQSVKTCQLFFEKTLKKTKIEDLKNLEFNFFCYRIPLPPPKTPYRICESFIFDNDLDEAESINIPDEVDSNLIKDLNQKQRNQTQKLWKMYRMIMLFRLPAFLETTDSDLVRYTAMISNIIDAYKSLGECPLILAIETMQTPLAILMIENEMLEICHCIDLKSMLKYVNTYHPQLTKYFTKQEKNPVGPNLMNRFHEILAFE